MNRFEFKTPALVVVLVSLAAVTPAMAQEEAKGAASAAASLRPPRRRARPSRAPSRGSAERQRSVNASSGHPVSNGHLVKNGRRVRRPSVIVASGPAASPRSTGPGTSPSAALVHRAVPAKSSFLAAAYRDRE